MYVKSLFLAITTAIIRHRIIMTAKPKKIKGKILQDEGKLLTSCR
jgi:hypothetical protein